MPIYSDIDFDLGQITSPGGSSVDDINLLLDSFDVAQSIKNILLTMDSERPFSNTPYGNLYSYKYEVLSGPQLLNLYQKIGAILSTVEPRATINSIELLQPIYGQLKVIVNYSPKWDLETVKTKSFTI